MCICRYCLYRFSSVADGAAISFVILLLSAPQTLARARAKAAATEKKESKCCYSHLCDVRACENWSAPQRLLKINYKTAFRERQKLLFKFIMRRYGSFAKYPLALFHLPTLRW